MKKVRSGTAGEITAEIFETWFPDKPEIILMDFIKTKQPGMIIVIKLDNDNYGVCNLNQEYANKLLEEFKIMRNR